MKTEALMSTLHKRGWVGCPLNQTTNCFGASGPQKNKSSTHLCRIDKQSVWASPLSKRMTDGEVILYRSYCEYKFQIRHADMQTVDDSPAYLIRGEAFWNLKCWWHGFGWCDVCWYCSGFPRDERAAKDCLIPHLRSQILTSASTEF